MPIDEASGFVTLTEWY